MTSNNALVASIREGPLFHFYTPSPLKSPEVLNLIFSNLDDAALAMSARACKQWSTIALDILWREVVDPMNLLRLLGEIELSDYGNDNIRSHFDFHAAS